MAHDAFISYPSENKPVADAVCATLEGRKVRCWIAPRDVQAGRGYAEQISVAIASSRVMVLIFSGHSNRSPHVMREVEIAINRGVPVLPLRIEDVAPEGGLDYYLKTIHWLDALTPPFEAHLDRLADTVERLLGAAPSASEAVVHEDRTVPAPARPTPWVAIAGVWWGLGAILLIAIFAARWFWPADDAPQPVNPPQPGPTPPAVAKKLLPTDLERLQGFWTLVASEREGKRESAEVGDFEVEFNGDDMWSYERPHPRTGGKVIFREDINPRGFDQVFAYERDGKKFQGRITWIYRFLDEDHLEMAFPSEDSFDRPSALVPRGFDSTKEKIEVVTFERKR